MSRPIRKPSPRKLRCEALESRCVLSTIHGGDDDQSLIVATPPDPENYYVHGDNYLPVIVAGDPSGTPADSPANRVDPNTADSPFAGVGSLRINTRRGAYICTATPIDATHLLTAAHCVDINNDGRSDKKDGISSVYFQLNLDTDAGTDQVDASIKANGWATHPDFTGFARPAVNDDLAVVTLSAPLPAGVPIYALATTPIDAGTAIHLVGYGRSGDGVSGYTVGASWTVKRTGQNAADAFSGQDDVGKPAGNEVFTFDFDGPNGNGSLGGATLGNDIETTLGGGDSGGPSFVLLDGADPALAESYQLVGVNTFTQGLTAPEFGSLGGGIQVAPYVDWILTAGDSPGGGGGGPGGGKGPKGQSSLAIRVANSLAAEDAALVADGLGSFTVTSIGITRAARSSDQANVPIDRPATVPLSAGLPRIVPTIALETNGDQALDRGDLLGEALESVLDEPHPAVIDGLDEFVCRR